MRSRKIDIPVQAENCTHIEVTVSYNAGGENWFTYEPMKRGYYVMVGPVTVNGRARGSAIGSAPQEMIQETGRFSETQLERWFYGALAEVQDLAGRTGRMFEKVVTAAEAKYDYGDLVDCIKAARDPEKIVSK